MIVTPILKPLLPPAAASSATRRWMWCEWASVRSTPDTLCGCCVSFPHGSIDELSAFGLQVAQFHLFLTKNDRSLIIDALYLCVLHGRPCCIENTYAKIGGMSIHFFMGLSLGEVGTKSRRREQHSDDSRFFEENAGSTFLYLPTRVALPIKVLHSIIVRFAFCTRGGGEVLTWRRCVLLTQRRSCL